MIKRPSKATLFLIELIIVTLFLSIASVVCVGIFAEGSRIMTENQERNQAIFRGQQLAELIKAKGSEKALEAIADQYGQYTNQGYSLYYNQDWEPTQSQDGIYQLQWQDCWQENLVESNITVTKGEIELFALTVSKYWPGGISHE